MIKLSKRLRAIVNFCDKNKIIADIGTDHGFVPNFLYEEDINRKIIATDISLNSLNKAIEFTELRGNKGKIEHIVCNGLEKIPPVDQIIIAGMGGILISKILDRDFEKARQAEKLILQPMQQLDYLRKFLYDKGFKILDEKIVFEDNKFFHIIVANYKAIKEEYRDIDLKVSKLLRNRKDKDLIEFLKYLINYNIFIIENIEGSSTRSIYKKDKLREENIELKEILDEVQK
ncbi:MAG: class I SAM-dependent methyltransferase [Peptoniphilus lacrimalis]|uniref:tRNA (adenine(22)-N(1))-methyltransferase n=1 Tax=Peptoniphilus lacrimalis TaxID=33031 RepID=UPI00254DE0E2|nr:class I SAM-dependent methyltransferase [Peptoniphilus lacrimalis]MDK8282086.1 class I SAM-dependent methyltransferase [Peptoniphilus lacrimalis]